MNQLQSKYKLGEITPNIASMLQGNLKKFSSRVVYQEKDERGEYKGITWRQFLSNIENIAANLKQLGFKQGDKMVLFSGNCLKMLELELAVMAYGGIAVPIFSHFRQATAELLIRHSDAVWLAVEGKYQLDNISENLDLDKIIVLDNIDDKCFKNLINFNELLLQANSEKSFLNTSLDSDTICLNMYTSGTMGVPKCVQLTHKNILSQQAGLESLWEVNENDRFLSYLPWHHSFGGIFELFTALYHGATYSLESSYGKNPKEIFANWKKIRPTAFFSVPKVYQALVELTGESREAEDMFFNTGLKFIFTAAAALPEKLSKEFQDKNIPVIEGWGLTETSPCCTITDPGLKRIPGVVGMPLPGVKVRIADDGEIQIKGPNVMKGYYKNDLANNNTFTKDGWYRTGDIGLITQSGLKLIARKDRIFKLSNGEKVIPTDLEKIIERKCHFVQHVIISGSGEDYPVALIFPNKKMFDFASTDNSDTSVCQCPQNMDEFSKCLQHCLKESNIEIKQKFSKIKRAVLVNDELTLENNTLTPSMKVAPNNVLERYKSHLLNLYGDNVPVDEEIFVVELT